MSEFTYRLSLRTFWAKPVKKHPVQLLGTIQWQTNLKVNTHKVETKLLSVIKCISEFTRVKINVCAHFFRLGKSAGRGIRHGGKTEGGSETQNFDSSTKIQLSLKNT